MVSLGLPRPPQDEDVEVPAGGLDDRIRLLLETRAEALGVEAWSELTRTPGVLGDTGWYSLQQAEFVAALLALSVVARGGESLDGNLLALPGGLLMPGLTVLLLLRFQG
jgi:hypothetical protein